MINGYGYLLQSALKHSNLISYKGEFCFNLSNLSKIPIQYVLSNIEKHQKLIWKNDLKSKSMFPKIYAIKIIRNDTPVKILPANVDIVTCKFGQ